MLTGRRSEGHKGKAVATIYVCELRCRGGLELDRGWICGILWKDCSQRRWAGLLFQVGHLESRTLAYIVTRSVFVSWYESALLVAFIWMNYT